MDAQQPSSIPEDLKAGVGVTSATADQTAASALGTPVDDPSNLQKRDEVIASIGRNGLVVVAGAGVSLQSVGHPAPLSDVAGWPGLLRHGVVHCLKQQLLDSDEAHLVRQQIDIGIKPGKTGYLIEAAQRIHDSLEKQSAGRYWWLHDSIGQLQVKDPRLIRAIQGLGGLVTTLNYDNLIEQVTIGRTIEWHQHAEVTRCVHAREKDVVIHLHGFWKTPDNIILDRLSYEKIKNDREACERLRTFARDFTMLFVGCGNTFFDPNFETLLGWAKEALRDVQHRHYVLCQQAEEPKLFSSLQAHGYLTSLVYGDDYADLSPFLEAIGRESGASSTAINPSVVPVPSTTTKPQRPADRWKLQSQR